ncbi:MAG: UDP-N-acetylmuramate:L-alanyl-gamma-D-glutamyl-meso-diaminopimelate ligase [Gammaproteobacteria bacterium]|nr:UDP-N-acetylmuramate:L-alanyl-gamma-D-glutamyl-meso-diaminopimelate ligase [Gammaproteobacteria bacterium]
MRLHILGICGTFMAGLAALARESGHQVSGSDANAWPPMSTQLETLGIEVHLGYEPSHLQPAPDLVIVGNVISRGNPAIEYVLDQGLTYTSGPQWLADHVLAGRHVLAVAGTHGKTTATSLLAFLLDRAGLEPGFLIGGVAKDFEVSARLGSGRCFVIEADEYDTAFFDKRSKFVHYRPHTLALNNLELDHTDIFPDLAAIERQFHHLIRTVPGRGLILINGGDENLARVMTQGCWSRVQRFDTGPGATIADWGALPTASGFELLQDGERAGACRLALAGNHNRANALAALAAAADVGVAPSESLAWLGQFRGVKRRLECLGTVHEVSVYDDFAHHPTAIRATLDALRGQVDGRLLAVLEPRSNTMRLGAHAQELARSLRRADLAFVYARPDLRWDARGALHELGDRLRLHAELDTLVDDVAAQARAGDRVLVMSNGDFGGIHARLLQALAAKPRS